MAVTMTTTVHAGQKRAAEHSAEEWEMQKPIFNDLYINQGLKLSQVSEIMKNEHGFVATDRQYKRKIVSWKLEKNLKANEKQAMIRKKIQRKAEGKDSKFHLNGRTVGDHKLERFLKENKENQVQGVATPKTPCNMICVTPGTADAKKNAQAPQPNTEEIIIEASQHPIVPLARPLGVPLNPLARTPQAKGILPSADSSIHSVERIHLERLYATYACMIWRGPWDKITRIEDQPKLPHGFDEIRTNNFIQWARTVLQTTRLSKSCVLLALLCLFRLRKMNPDVVAKKGSEYHAAAVALMLANKFSDDWCYTNKTWSEITGIPTSDLHVMEIEFMTNMDYNFYVSEEEWSDWTLELSQMTKAKEMANQDCDPLCLHEESVAPAEMVLQWTETVREGMISSGERTPSLSTFSGSSPEHSDSDISFPSVETNFDFAIPLIPTEQDFHLSASDSSPEKEGMAPPHRRLMSTVHKYDNPTLTTALTPKSANSPARSVTPLSPSDFFSPKENFVWPSFLEEPKGLPYSKLKDEHEKFSANPNPENGLHYRPIQAPRDYAEASSSSSPMALSPSKMQSPVW